MAFDRWKGGEDREGPDHQRIQRADRCQSEQAGVDYQEARNRPQKNPLHAVLREKVEPLQRSVAG